MVTRHVISPFSYSFVVDRLAGRAHIFPGGGAELFFGTADPSFGRISSRTVVGNSALDGYDFRRGLSGQFAAAQPAEHG